MMRLARAAALAAITQSILHSPTMADANIATTSPQADTPGWLQSQTLEMSLENTRTPSLQYTLLPSTVNMGLNGTAITMNVSVARCPAHAPRRSRCAFCGAPSMPRNKR